MQSHRTVRPDSVVVAGLRPLVGHLRGYWNGDHKSVATDGIRRGRQRRLETGDHRRNFMSTAVAHLQTKENRQRREVCEIPFEVISQSSSRLRHVPMTTGLCVPQSAMFDCGEWVVEGLGGAHFPAQIEVLNCWSDGSVRWLLVHFVAGRVLPGRTSCALVRYKQPHMPATASVRWVGAAIVVQKRNCDEESTVRIVPEVAVAAGQR